ncbi:MAG TPA: outer membrane lipoprotein-sorting protein [Methylomirabilota bacterium]|nr:outer membrane lipoprotein-sorting protein [Methylomirabilota bacterium]
MKAFVAIILAAGISLVAAQQSKAPAAPRVFEGRTTIQDDAGEGQRLMESLIGAPPSANSSLYGTFVIRDADDKRTEIPVRWLTQRETDTLWHDVFETKQVVGHPAQRFIVTHEAGKTNRYALAVANLQTGEFPKPSPLAREKLFSPFAGTDYWLADLGLDFYHWPAVRIVKTEMRKGRSCRVVECLNPKPTPGAYSRVLCWIDYESGGLVRAEAFDSNNQRLKEFSVRKVKRVDGRVQLREIEMRNVKTDSSSVLQFEVEFDDPQK